MLLEKHSQDSAFHTAKRMFLVALELNPRFSYES